MNNALANLSVKQLHRAIKIKTKLEVLQEQLSEILGSEIPVPGPGKSKRRMSAAGRAVIAAGQKARWAKVNGTVAEKPAKQGRRKMSAAGRARISAAAKKRWKLAKAAGKTRL